MISLAANCDQEENLAEARHRLSKILFSTTYTKAIWTEPFVPEKASQASRPQDIGSHTKRLYLNQLVYAGTTLCAEELENKLKDIEQQMGRTAEDKKKGIVRIDLDLMQHDALRYHLRDWERPYIQQLIAER